MANHQILNSAEHRDLRVLAQPSSDLGDGTMAAFIIPSEFRRVQGEFPIVFRQNLESGAFSALAMLGFETGENLYLDDGKWLARYRPLSLAIQPFLIGPQALEGGESQVHVDMEHPRISKGEDGFRVFDEDGGTTPYLEGIADGLGELHAGLQAMPGFIDALKRYELLEPFSLEVPLSNGSKQSLVGFHIIDEQKLHALDGDALGDLHAHGYLLPIFMAVASLSHFSTLIQRKDAKLANG